MKQQVEDVAEKTTEYIRNLPNETNITMYEAAKAASPDMIDQLDFTDLFDLTYAVIENIGKTDVVLDYSEHEGKVEGLLFNLDFYVYQKRLQKAKIVTNLLCYGPCPEPNDPIEQHLTISSTGRVWFSEKILGSPDDSKHPTGRKVQMSIGRGRAAAILSKLADLKEPDPFSYCTDCGSWHLTLTRPDGTKVKMTDSANNGVILDGENLTDFIRNRIPIESLMIFGIA